VAFAKLGEDAPIPDTLREIEYTFMGLMAFSWNVKENVTAAVKNCYHAGVDVVILTPDNKQTAVAVARKAGLISGVILTGEELEELKASGGRISDKVNIFAEITPEQKADIVELLKSSGEVTAVFGSNSSDTDALESADVGISLSKNTAGREWDLGMDTLSQHTTGCACEACDFIMEENSVEGSGFVKVSNALREARRLHRNIKCCISSGISTLVVLALFGFFSLIITAGADEAHVFDVVFVSILTVFTVPLLLTFFFIKNVIDLKSDMTASAFIGNGSVNKKFILAAIIQGLSLFAVLFAAFLILRAIESTTAQKLRAFFLTAFVSGALVMSWVGLSGKTRFYKGFAKVFTDKTPMRDWRANAAILITATMLLFLPVIIYLPYVNSALGLGEYVKGAPNNLLHPLIFILSLFVGAASQVWFDFIKRKFYD